MGSAESVTVTVSCLRATKGCKELPLVLGCDASVGICQMTEEGVTWATASCVEVEVTQAFLKAPTVCYVLHTQESFLNLHKNTVRQVLAFTFPGGKTRSRCVRDFLKIIQLWQSRIASQMFWTLTLFSLLVRCTEFLKIL